MARMTKKYNIDKFSKAALEACRNLHKAGWRIRTHSFGSRITKECCALTALALEGGAQINHDLTAGVSNHPNGQKVFVWVSKMTGWSIPDLDQFARGFDLRGQKGTNDNAYMAGLNLRKQLIREEILVEV